MPEYCAVRIFQLINGPHDLAAVLPYFPGPDRRVAKRHEVRRSGYGRLADAGLPKAWQLLAMVPRLDQLRRLVVHECIPNVKLGLDRGEDRNQIVSRRVEKDFGH